MSLANNEDSQANGKFLSIQEHRKNRNYASGLLMRRVFWAATKWLFLMSPRHLYGWRNFLLRSFGAKIGKHVRIYPSADIFYPWNFVAGDWATIGPNVKIYSLGKIQLGANVLVSQGAHLCAGTHDYRLPNLPLLTPPITIEPEVWICAEAFIGPGVTIGRGAIVAARAVVVKDIPEKALVGGNPARIIKMRDGAQ